MAISTTPGQFRTYAESISPLAYFPFNDAHTEWSTDRTSSWDVTASTVGGYSATPNTLTVIQGVVPNETAGGALLGGATFQDWQLYDPTNGHPDTTTVVTFQTEGPAGGSKPPGGYATYDPYNPPSMYASALFGIRVPDNQQFMWRLATDGDPNIKLLVCGMYYDLTDPATNYQGWNREFVYDTGIPTSKVFDGRPHLFVVSQHVTVTTSTDAGGNPVYNLDAGQVTVWMQNLDGGADYTYTSPRGMTGSPQQAAFFESEGNSTAVFDELGFWTRQLTSTEKSQLETNWGAEPPWEGSADFSDASSATFDQNLRREGGGAFSSASSAAFDNSPADVEVFGTKPAPVQTSFPGGQPNVAGKLPWISARRRAVQRAAKWLEDNPEILHLPPALVAHGASTVSGRLKLTNDLAGDAVAGATVLGNLAYVRYIEGATAGAATVAGDLGFSVTLDGGTASGRGTAQGDLILTHYRWLQGRAAGQASATGTLRLHVWLTGDLAAGMATATPATLDLPEEPVVMTGAPLLVNAAFGD